MAENKRMGGMNLSDFGKSSPQQTDNPPAPKIQQQPTEREKPVAKTKRKAKSKKKEKTATLNIQVTRSQQRWLQDTAQDIRDNNEEPVPGPDRVYPVHLIQAAIELLKSQDVTWDEITDIKSLKDALKI